MGWTIRNVVCTQCGTPADTGLIFCRKCTRTLRPPVPLVAPPKQDNTRANTPSAHAKSTLVGVGLRMLFVGLLLIPLEMMIPDHLINAILAVEASVLLVGILLVAYGTVTKNRWGVNLEAINCPACGSPIPKVRRPESLKQALWGGGTCRNCGCEMDKWGRPITLIR